MIALDQLAKALEETLESLVEWPSMTARDRAVVQATAVAVRLARDLARSGQDPVVVIEQIRSAVPQVAAADRAVDDSIRERWPPKG
jgi:hypothetical protein